MRLISWNVQRKVKAGLQRQVEALASRDPDVVALQEVTATTGVAFREELCRVGLTYVQASLDLVEAARENGLRSKGGVLLASRWPLRVLPPTEFRVPWPERVLSALVDTPWGPVEVHTVYVPIVSTGPSVSLPLLKAETFEGIFERLARNSEWPRILCGDFNAPYTEESDGAIVPFGRKGRPARAELSVLQGLRQFDLLDAFRSLRGYELQEFSWYGRVNGYRIDHVFASRSLNAVACEYLHGLREERLSDHSAIEACFVPGSGRWVSC